MPTEPCPIHPLPTDIDVPASKLEKHQLFTAVLLMIGAAGSWPDTDGELYVQAWEDPYPHTCIARWAGNKPELWARFYEQLHRVRFQSLQDTSIDWDSFPEEQCAYLICTAKAWEIYQAIVKAGWNAWRVDYAKRLKQAKEGDAATPPAE